MKLPNSWVARPLSSQATDAMTGSMALIAEQLTVIEHKLHEQAAPFQSGIEEYISYACSSSGKRLRPMLALLAGGATGNIGSEHLDLALILELIHIASLVHDDIMDGAEIRRERPTLNARWGNTTTVLVGDLLFTHALRLATHFSEAHICRRIADATLDVCSGEILQTEGRFDFNLTVQRYYRMIEMKTGSLFSVACELGAVLNQAPAEVVTLLKEYGNHIGIAYQLLDDCIDLVGDEKAVGKTLRTDLSGGKLTLPVLMLLQKASQQEQERIQGLMKSGDQTSYEELIHSLLEQGALDVAVTETHRLIDQAEAALSSLPENVYVGGLRGITIYLRGLLETIKEF